MTTFDAQPAELDIKELRGVVATVNLTGQIEARTAEDMLHLALWNAGNGFTNVEYLTFPAQLVETGRDMVARHALENNYDWLLMIDGDATFAANSLAQILHSAYISQPDADVMGAYSQLKSTYLPTIDTGTGTWEPHFPGEGILPAIRTGGHFLLVKTPLLRRFGPPWFRTRQTLAPTRVLAELDNFSRMHFDGRNPLQDSDAWPKLVELARETGGEGGGDVGEDSAFCDAVKAAGGSIYVDTNIVTGHIERQVISPADLREHMEAKQAQLAATVGAVLD